MAYTARHEPVRMVQFMLASIFGASAPDWMEIARFRSTWFGWGPRIRESVIPHRTITHTFCLSVLAVVGTAIMALRRDQPGWDFAFAFCLSAFGHLVLDIRTPMGIPLWPFGRRYRWYRGEVVPSRYVERRSGW
jgi:inner membrane protein